MISTCKNLHLRRKIDSCYTCKCRWLLHLCRLQYTWYHQKIDTNVHILNESRLPKEYQLCSILTLRASQGTLTLRCRNPNSLSSVPSGWPVIYYMHYMRNESLTHRDKTMTYANNYSARWTKRKLMSIWHIA